MARSSSHNYACRIIFAVSGKVHKVHVENQWLSGRLANHDFLYYLVSSFICRVLSLCHFEKTGLIRILFGKNADIPDSYWFASLHLLGE